MAFPSIGTPVVSSESSSVTTHDVTLPASVAAGDLVIAAVFLDGTPGNPSRFTWPSPWVELADQDISTVASMTVAYLIASGGETTVAVTSVSAERSTHIAALVTGWDGSTPPEISTVATGASTTPNATSVTASWGSADNLFITLYGIDSGAPTAYPTNYSLAQTSTTTTPTSAAYGGLAARQLAAASDDPGAFTNSTSDNWAAYTIVVKPGAAAGAALAGSAAGTSTAAGVLTTSIKLVGSAAGGSTAAAALTTAIKLAAVSAGTSSAAAALTTAIALAGSSAGVATADGALTTAIALVGSSAGSSTADGVLSDAGTLCDIALVQNKVGNGSVTFDATATAGNLIVLFVTRRDAGSSITTPTGYTASPEGVTFESGGNRGVAMFWKESDGSETSVSITGDTTIHFAEFSGIDTSAIVDSAVDANEFDTSYEVGVLDGTGQDRVLVIGGVAGDYFGNTNSVSPGTGVTELSEGTAAAGEKPGSWFAYKVVDSPSSTEDLVGTGPNNNHTGQSLMFAACTAGAGIALAGSSAGTSTAVGVLTTEITLAGSSAGAATADGALTTQITLQGSAAGSSTAAGNLTVSISLVGSSGGTSSASGSLTTAIPLVGSAAGIASAAAALTTAIPLVGSAAGTSSAVAALTTAIALAGSSAGGATADAVLTTAIRLVGSSAGGSTAVAVLGNVSIPGNSRAAVALVAAPTASAAMVAIPAAVVALVEATGAAVAVVPIGSGVVALVAIPSAEVS